MMGHRGCRLAVTYPEIARDADQRLLSAQRSTLRKLIRIGTSYPEIMIPLVGDIKELKYVKKIVVETADAEIAAAGSRPEV